MAFKEESQRYHRVKNIFFFSSLIFDFLLLLMIFTSGLSFALKNVAAQISTNTFIHNGVYLAFFGMGLYAVHFPLQVFLGFTWEHKFGLSNQSFSAWLKDDMKGAVLGFVVSLILVELIYVLLGKFPQHWWIGAGFLWIFFSFVLAKLTPNFIIPLFFKYQPIENASLKKRIFELFASCQVDLKDVYAIDMSAKTKKANAFLCGIGKNRRVVLSDTLLSNFGEEEIEIVVAHELGHYKHRDMIKLLWANGITIFIGFYLVHRFFLYAVGAYQLSGLDDISFLPMVILAFMLFGLLTSPLLNGYSRKIEEDADRFSIETTKKPGVFVSMIRKLGEMNLAQFEPSRLIEIFLYDHPPIAKRIAFAKGFQYDG